MTDALPYIEPPLGLVWVPLIQGLGWVRYYHAAAPEELLPNMTAALGLSEQACQLELQDSWRTLADESSVRDIHIRGCPHGSAKEQRLTVDDLRNCRWLAWEQNSDGRHVVLVERYGGSYEEQWDRLADTSGSDYRHVVVSRVDLLCLHPPLKQSEQRQRASNAQSDRALAWLEGEFDGHPEGSVPKGDFLQRMTAQFGISQTQATLNWRQAVHARPGWSRPGPRGKRNSTR